jgi:hypothetical protein
MTSFDNVTVVVAHGAWADGSSWSEVIARTRLLSKGLFCSLLRPHLPFVAQTVFRTKSFNEGVKTWLF